MVLPEALLPDAERLRLAVSGLAGLAGMLLVPTLSSWLKLMVHWMQRDRSGLRRPSRFSGLDMAQLAVLTFSFGFFVVMLARAAGELRQIRVEAPVAGASFTGLVVGVAVFAFYAGGIGFLSADARRTKGTRHTTSTLSR